MKKSNLVSRRGFLKASGVVAAGVGATAIVPKKSYAASAGSVWVDRMPINPNIDNLRVAVCHDQNMISGTYNFANWPPYGSSNWNALNAALNYNQIYANMDEMAKTLAQKPTADEAWRTIFRKPDTKQWSEVKVGIKPCGFNTRVPVVAKICNVLAGFGVPGSNMAVWETIRNGATMNKDLFGTAPHANAFPAGVVFCNNESPQIGGPKTPLGIPGYNLIGSDATCPGDLVDGTRDILVNISGLKPHNDQFGAVTLTMKNHFGTFTPNPIDATGQGIGHDLSWLYAISKSNELLGGNPVRQQLCISDCLWGSDNPSGSVTPTCTPGRLVMGTFSMAVDYLIANATWDVPETYKGTFHFDTALTNRTRSYYGVGFMEAAAFGYTSADAAGLDFVNVPPATGITTVKPQVNTAKPVIGQNQNNFGSSYSITGQKISGNRKTAKGIVIKQGKKILM